MFENVHDALEKLWQHFRKSSVILRNFWKMFENVLAFEKRLENFWKSSESGQKSSEKCD